MGVKLKKQLEKKRADKEWNKRVLKGANKKFQEELSDVKAKPHSTFEGRAASGSKKYSRHIMKYHSSRPKGGWGS